MGYVVGQNSPRSAKLQADAGAQTPAGGSGMSDARPQPASAALPPAAPPAQPPAEANSAQAQAQGGQSSAAESPSAPAPAPANPAPAPAPNGPVSELAPGSYWQVMALHQADAEVLVHTLRDMGLPALLSPAPNNLMRVLVGPYTDTETMGRAKSQLENAGFHPIKK